MPENDQTRWIGIRPVNPSEDIPTTTRKLAPAIADLQAIKAAYREKVFENNKDCSVDFTVSAGSVPGGEIWIVNHIAIRNNTSICDMQISARQAANYYEIVRFYSVEPTIFMSWCGQLILEAGERVRFNFYLGGVTDNIQARLRGYKIGVY